MHLKTGQVLAAVALTLSGGLVLASSAGAAVQVLGSTVCSNSNQCMDATADSAGAMYATNYYTNTIDKFDSNGSFLTSWGSYGTGPGQFEYPSGVALDSSGNVYVVDENAVEKFTSAGAYIQTMGSSLGGGHAIAVSPAGNVYVTNSNYRVIEYNSSGSQIHSAQLGTGGLPSAGDVDGVAYNGANGDVYVVDAPAALVLEFDASLNYLGSWGVSGTGAGQLNNPRGIAVDSSGNVYVSEYGVGRIQEFTAAGSYLGVTTFSGEVQTYMSIVGTTIYASHYSAGILRIDLGQPVAALSLSSSTPQTSQSVTLDASASVMPFGSITDYRWDLDGSGTFATDTGTTSTTSTLFTTSGSHTVSVRVTGSNGATAVSSATLTVGSSSASLHGPLTAVTGQSITFDASGSALANSSITDYRWDLDGSGTFATDTGTTSTEQTSFATSGNHTVSVRVTRSGGVVDTASATVAVTPAPPPGAVGVVINGGDYATDSPAVTINLVWPAGATTATVSNDGGFGSSGGAKTVPVGTSIPWTLVKTGSDRLPKTVYVRFSSTGITTLTDSIILDETVPTISQAALLSATTPVPQSRTGAKAKALPRYKLVVVAAEKISGVSEIDTSSSKSGGVITVLSKATKRGQLQVHSTITVASSKPVSFVRVRSTAGKWSAWHALTKSAH